MADYGKDQPPPYTQGGYPPQQYPQQQYPPQQYPPQQQYPAQQYPQQQYPAQTYPAQQVVVVQQQPRGPSPQTNAVLAWIACLCFFWPLGLVAVLKANEADRCIGRGDFDGARQNGEAARKWAIASIITQVVLGVVVGIIYAIYVVAILNSVNSY